MDKTFKSTICFVSFIALALLSSSWMIDHTPRVLAAPASSSTIFLPMILGGSGSGTPASSWLTEMNAMRALANLPAVAENTTWDMGDSNHAKYMVKNGAIGHSETPGNPWYTSSGDQAAGNGNVMGTADVNATDVFAIDLWMKGPFHAIGILDPLLQQSAYGSYREATSGFPKMAATLDVLRGLGSSVPGGVSFPILWPATGKTSPFASIGPGEYPDPIRSCAGYAYPMGMPVYLQLGTMYSPVTPSVTSYSFKRGNTALSICEFDQTNYSNSDSAAQSLGRAVLQERNAIVLVPQAPLTPGAAYTASITTNGSTYTWSFTVSSAPRAPARMSEGATR